MRAVYAAVVLVSRLPLNPFDDDPPPEHGFPMAGGRFPKVGHLPALAWDMPGFFDWAHEQYGPTTWIDRGFGSQVLQLSGEASFDILRNKQTDSSPLYDVAATFLGRSMIVVDGHEHRRVRAASSHAFTPAGLDRAQVGRIIAEVVSERTARWSRRGELPIAREMREMALAVIFRIIGVATSDIPAWRHAFEELALSALNLPWDFPGSPMRRGKRAAAWLERHIRRILHDVRRREDRDSLVGAMVHGRDERGEMLDDRELVDNVRLLVLAGHETTASVLAWAMLLLAQDPQRWQRLCAEAAEVDAITCAADLSRAPYAEGVFREALRLYPPVSSTIRRVTDAFEIAGVRVPRGTILGCNLHELSRDPERYPEPDAFQPERWVELGHRPSQLETCQFGGGPHFCLGYHVALLEGVALLIAAARTLSRHGLRPTPAGPLPRPRFLPVVHPPRQASLRLA